MTSPTASRRLLLGAAAVATLGLSGCTATDGATGRTRRRARTDDRIVLPARPKAYFLGDSWTKGYSADPGRGYAAVVGASLGWDVDLGDDGSGGGFVHTFNPNGLLFADRAAALHDLSVDLVVIQGGLNDAVDGASGLERAVRRTVEEVRRAAHDAPIVLLGPASPTGVPTDALVRVDQQESAVAAQLHVPFISPLEQDWINPANVSWIIDPATGHPSTQGHLYFGGRVAQALERVVRTG